MTWKKSRPSKDGTHHVTEKGSLYSQRFEKVQSFHEPGLAPVRKDREWYHITPEGQPAYNARYDEAYGFYHELAAVRLGQEWFHIKPDGSRAYIQKYSWCGNYQQCVCTVRNQDGRYHHIDQDGKPIYSERYLYAGDFKEGYSVVSSPEGSTHIDEHGREIHGRYFPDLGVFHKGYAAAKDRYGWFHIDKEGQPLYVNRYRYVEPFYNGYALCERLDGALTRISPTGRVLEERVRAERKEEKKIVLIGNISSGKTTWGRRVQEILGYDYVSIDDCRKMLGDGTVSGEYRAWSHFVSRCEEPVGTILEFSGGGPHVYNVAKGLENSELETHIIWLDSPLEKSLRVSETRSFDTPYPYEMGDLRELTDHIQSEISTAWIKVWNTSRFQTHRVKDPRNTSIEQFLRLLED